MSDTPRERIALSLSRKVIAWVPPTRDERRASLMEYSNSRPNDPSRSMQHMLDLDDEFPTVEIFGPQCISAEVGPGWKELLRPVLTVLSENGCKAGQIKQKFGGLRFYWNFTKELESQLDEWADAGRVGELPGNSERERLRGLIGPIVSHAEEMSYRTCDVCGTDVGDRGASHQTICDDCRKR